MEIKLSVIQIPQPRFLREKLDFQKISPITSLLGFLPHLRSCEQFSNLLPKRLLMTPEEAILSAYGFCTLAFTGAFCHLR